MSNKKIDLAAHSKANEPRRNALKAFGWVTPMVIAASLPKHAQATTLVGETVISMGPFLSLAIPDLAGTDASDPLNFSIDLEQVIENYTPSRVNFAVTNQNPPSCLTMTLDTTTLESLLPGEGVKLSRALNFIAVNGVFCDIAASTAPGRGSNGFMIELTFTPENPAYLPLVESFKVGLHPPIGVTGACP